MPNEREAGAQLLKQGNAAGAIPLLEEALRANPNDAHAHAFLGAALGQVGRLPESAEHFGHAARLAPTAAPLQFNLGAALEKAGRPADAIEAYRRAMQLDPGQQRAAQALARLGAEAPAAMSAASLNTGSASAASLNTGTVSDFSLDDAPTPAVAPQPAYQAAYQAAGPSASQPFPVPAPQYGAATVTDTMSSTWAAPPPGPAPAYAPLNAEQTYAPPYAPPGYGPPAAPAPAGAYPPWETPPPPQVPGLRTHDVSRTGAVVATVEHEERGMPRSAFLGNCYLKGMGMGLWWGLIGAVIFFLYCTAAVMKDDFNRALFPILTMCAMWISFGALAFGLIGLIGGAADEPEGMCSNLGIGLGLLTALVIMPFTLSLIMYTGPLGLFGCTWVSRMMAKALGRGIEEWQGSVMVVASGSGVVISRAR